MKRLAILSYSMGSGGAERVIYHLLPELTKEYQVFLFLIYKDIHYEIPAEVTVEYLYGDASNHNFRAVRSIPEGAKKFLFFVRKYNVDISLSFTFRPNIINGIVKKRMPGLKCIMSERDYPGGMNGKSNFSHFIHGWLRRRYYNFADMIISNSIHINTALRDKYRIAVPMQVIYNPVTLPTQLAVVSEKSDRIDIVSVGQFIQLKNHSLILEAINEMPNMKLTILGDGRLRKSYEEFIIQNHLSERVILPGKTKDVYSYLFKTDVFVLSSNTEGFPNALLEAMSAGLPVISTNCMSGPLEMLNDNNAVQISNGDFAIGKYGLLINVNDELGLRKALAYFSDTEHRRCYAKLARKRAEDYSLSTISGQYLSALANVLIGD